MFADLGHFSQLSVRVVISFLLSSMCFNRRLGEKKKRKEK